MKPESRSAFPCNCGWRPMSRFRSSYDHRRVGLILFGSITKTVKNMLRQGIICRSVPKLDTRGIDRANSRLPKKRAPKRVSAGESASISSNTAGPNHFPVGQARDNLPSGLTTHGICPRLVDTRQYRPKKKKKVSTILHGGWSILYLARQSLAFVFWVAIRSGVCADSVLHVDRHSHQTRRPSNGVGWGHQRGINQIRCEYNRSIHGSDTHSKEIQTADSQGLHK